jgi:hypothetical protein
MNEPADNPDLADVLFLERGLVELCASDAPPDLSARVRAATPADRAAAVAAVAAAERPRAAGRWFVAAAALLGVTVLASVFALQRGAASAPATQGQGKDSAHEVTVRDAAHLATLLPRLQAVTLLARSDAAGNRLPELPEHTALLASPLPRQLATALAGLGTTADPFGLAVAQAELVLHLDGREFVRARLRCSELDVFFGTASFAAALPLPTAVAAALRARWQELVVATVKPRQKLQASNLREFIAAIGSDRTIELSGAPFVLGASDERGDLPANPAVHWLGDGPNSGPNSGNVAAQIHGVHNLHVRALGDRVAVLGKTPAEVLGLSACDDVCFEGLILGHVEGLEYGCVAPVLTLDHCRGVRLVDCELFGCGTEGVVATATQRIAMERCEVHTCRCGVAQFRGCEDLQFTATRFRDCTILWQEGGFVFDDCKRVAFTDCTVTGMNGGAPDTQLFGIRMDEAVAFTGGIIAGNRCGRVATSKLLLVRDGTEEHDNGPAVVPIGGLKVIEAHERNSGFSFHITGEGSTEPKRNK